MLARLAQGFIIIGIDEETLISKIATTFLSSVYAKEPTYFTNKAP